MVGKHSSLFPDRLWGRVKKSSEADRLEKVQEEQSFGGLWETVCAQMIIYQTKNVGKVEQRGERRRRES